MNLQTAINLAVKYNNDHQIGTVLIVQCRKKSFSLVTGADCINYQKEFNAGSIVAEFESTWEWVQNGNSWKKVNTSSQQTWLKPQLDPSQN